MAPFVQFQERVVTVNLSIKGVPAEVAAALRARAERNHRSLQGELMSIIERAARDADGASSVDDAQVRQPARRRGHKTIEQIAAEHRALYPEPFARLPRAVDMIREDRDSR